MCATYSKNFKSPPPVDKASSNAVNGQPTMSSKELIIIISIPNLLCRRLYSFKIRAKTGSALIESNNPRKATNKYGLPSWYTELPTKGIAMGMDSSTGPLLNFNFLKKV